MVKFKVIVQPDCGWWQEDEGEAGLLIDEEQTREKFMELLNNEIERLNTFYLSKQEEFENALEDLKSTGYQLVYFTQ